MNSLVLPRERFRPELSIARIEQQKPAPLRSRLRAVPYVETVSVDVIPDVMSEKERRRLFSEATLPTESAPSARWHDLLLSKRYPTSYVIMSYISVLVVLSGFVGALFVPGSFFFWGLPVGFTLLAILYHLISRYDRIHMDHS